MMKDIEIKISRETRMVDLSKTTIGNDGENLQGNLVFSFTDDFVKGQARLEYVIDSEKKYALLLKGKDNYYIPIKSVMTKEGQIDMQLVITEGTDTSEIPIFKSNVFYVSCKKSINAEVEEEEGYYSWIEIANTKLNEVDEAIEELASQSNYAKEQGDYAKEQGTNAKNVADDTQKKAEEGKFNGKSLEFVWQGTKLGVRLEGQEAYQFVDLQGVQGEIGATGEPFKIKKTYASVSEMNADFRNMEFGDYVMIASSVEVEDNAKLYTRGESAWIFISDFSGAMGIRGETGLTPNIKIGEVKTLEAGSQAKVTRSGSNEEPVFNFELPKGDKGDDYVLTEEDKVEIGEKVNTEYEERITENEKYISDLEATIDILTNTDTKKGELVHITDALNLPTFKNVIDGNVEQEGEPSPTSPQEIEVLEGYNLFNELGVTQGYGLNGTGVIYENTQWNVLEDYIEVLPNIDCVFSCDTDGVQRHIVEYDESKNFIKRASTTGAGLFTTTNTTKYVRCAYRNDMGGNKYQFTKGSYLKPYIPYGCIGVKNIAKNILSVDMFINNTIPSINTGQNVSGAGNTATSYIEINNSLPLIYSTSQTGKGKYAFYYDENYNYLGYKANTAEAYLEISNADYYKNAKYIRLRLDGVVKETIEKAQLEYNSTVTPYEPYQEQIVPLDLKGNWVGAINDDIKDYLVTDKKKYWLVKNVGKLVFDGSEDCTIDTWFTSDDNSTHFKYNFVKYGNTANTQIVMSTHFKFVRGQKQNNGYIYTNLPAKFLLLSTNAISTVEEFKQWLKQLYDNGTPVIVYYALANPEIIELGELPKPIKTFEGTNNIQLLANLDTEIEVVYAQDVKKYFENKLAEISAQII